MTSYLQYRTSFLPQVRTKPVINLGIVVVIPAYDEPELLRSLMALKKCDRTRSGVEVIVVVNNAENAPQKIKDRNRATYLQAYQWSANNSTPNRKFHILYAEELPPKHAGVGMARKIGMDEACFRFEKAKIKRGIIACFDADSRCDKNYLVALEEHFTKNTRTQACSIYFEHPLTGIYFDENVYEAIIRYELHLRYYTNAQRWTGFPHACETIGSSMAVRSDAYQEQGGMNRRKAGEDFYFIHKFTALGKFSELNTTRVIPSPRPSHRVPFGTGKAVGEIVKNKQQYQTYHPESFVALKAFFSKVNQLFELKENELAEWLEQLPQVVQNFLKEQDFNTKLFEIQGNTTNKRTFKNRLFRWFNAFLVMKYVHYARDHFYPNIGVEEASVWLLKELNLRPAKEANLAKSQLLALRIYDRAL